MNRTTARFLVLFMILSLGLTARAAPAAEVTPIAKPEPDASATASAATDKATSVAGLPADAARGKRVAFKLSGEMTIRNGAQPPAWDVKATLDGENLSGAARTFLYKRDFGFEPPAIAGMHKGTDGVTVTVNFAADEVK